MLTDRSTAEHAGAKGSAQEEVRAVALGLLDAIDEHPWLAIQLTTQPSRSPWGSVTPRIFERLGQQVGALGAPRSSWYMTTSALMHSILGAAGQNIVAGVDLVLAGIAALHLPSQ